MAEKPKKKAPGADPAPMAPSVDPDQKVWDQVAFNEWKELYGIGKFRNDPELRADEAGDRADLFMERRAQSKGKFSDKKEGAE